MDGDEYLARFNSVKSYREKEALLREAQELENKDRELFARKRRNWREPKAGQPLPGLVRVFDETTQEALFIERKWFPEQDATPKMFEQDEEKRKGTRRAPVTVESLDTFKKQFLDVFSSKQFRYMNWDNVVAAGGSVTACVTQIPKEHNKTLSTRRAFYNKTYPSSDVDLFLYNLSEEEANAKLVEIYEAVCKACPFKLVCFRSKNAVTMVSQYPFRHIQVVLRLYSSPYEILAGFDVDSCTFLFDGHAVYTTPRGHHAITSMCNTIDLSRRSPSYEMRLAKYAKRGFEVIIPTLRRSFIDPNIYDMSCDASHGLQRLLLIEHQMTADKDQKNQKNQKRSKTKKTPTDESNYSTVLLQWGPGFNADKTMRAMLRQDAVLNSPKVRGERSYNLHPCFFGTAQEVLGDCSPSDPPIPSDAPDVHLRQYVTGALTWLRDDPGRQQIGSFHPLSMENWENGVYILDAREELFEAVNRNDVEALKACLRKLEGQWSLTTRDSLGRTPLHVGLLSGAVDCCNLLLDADLVDPTLRLPDGTSVLCLVARYDRFQVLDALLASVERLEQQRLAYEKMSENEKTEMLGAREQPPLKIDRKKLLYNDTSSRSRRHRVGALGTAISLGREKVLRALLHDFGASADRGELLLRVSPTADADMQKRIVEILLDHGYTESESFGATTYRSYKTSSVLHLLAIYGHTSLLKIIVAGLEQRGRSELLFTLLAQEDYKSMTPLQRAVESGNFDCAQFLYDKLPHVAVSREMRARLQMDFDPNVYYKTIVHLALDNLVSRWVALESNGECPHEATKHMQTLRHRHAYLTEGKELVFDHFDKKSTPPPDDAWTEYAKETLVEQVNTSVDMLFWSLEKDYELGHKSLTQSFPTPPQLGFLSLPMQRGGNEYNLGFPGCCKHVFQSKNFPKTTTLVGLVDLALKSVCVRAHCLEKLHDYPSFRTKERGLCSSAREMILELEKSNPQGYRVEQLKGYFFGVRKKRSHRGETVLDYTKEIVNGVKLHWWDEELVSIETTCIPRLLTRLDILKQVLQTGEKAKKRMSFKSFSRKRFSKQSNANYLMYGDVELSPVDMKWIKSVVEDFASKEVEFKANGERHDVNYFRKIVEPALTTYSFGSSKGEKGLLPACQALRAFEAAQSGALKELQEILTSEPKLAMAWDCTGTSLIALALARCPLEKRQELAQKLLDIALAENKEEDHPFNLLVSHVPVRLGKIEAHLLAAAEDGGGDSVRELLKTFHGFDKDTVLFPTLDVVLLLENDVQFLAFWLERISQLYHEPNLQDLQLACIELNRPDCLRVTVTSLSRYASNLPDISEAFNEEFTKALTKEPVDYNGLNSILFERKSRKLQTTSSVKLSGLVQTWVEKACSTGSFGMLQWLLDNVDETAHWFDEWLTTSCRDKLSRALEFAMEQLRSGESPLLAKDSSLQEKIRTAGQLMTYLFVHSQSGTNDFGLLNPSGRSLFGSLLQSSSFEEYIERHPNLRSLVNRPCLDDEAGRIRWPIHVVNFDEKRLAALQRLGVDPLQVTLPEGETILHMRLRESRARRLDVAEGAIDVFQRVFGRAALVEALSHRDANGDNCLDILVRIAGTRVAYDTLAEFASPDWFSPKNGETLFHHALEKESIIKVPSHLDARAVMKWLPVEMAATHESVRGDTAVDEYLAEKAGVAYTLTHATPIPKGFPSFILCMDNSRQGDYRGFSLAGIEHPLEEIAQDVVSSCIPRLRAKTAQAHSHKSDKQHDDKRMFGNISGKDLLTNYILRFDSRRRSRSLVVK